MARNSQTIQSIVVERLDASSVRETRWIADGVVDVGSLVDLAVRRRQLVQDLGYLRGRIVGRSSQKLIVVLENNTGL